MIAHDDPRPLVSIVLPVYNEEQVLTDLVARLDAVTRDLVAEYRFELVFVDDGSTDGTIRALERLQERDGRLRIVRLRRNYGQTAALQAGFDSVAGELVISMDADLQHFPEDVPRFLAKLREGYDVVCGWRRDRQEGIRRRWPSRAANWLLRKVTRLSIHDIGTTFRAYRTDLLRDVRLLGENHRFVPVFARQAGARIAEVEIQNVARAVGASNYGLGRTFNVLLDIIFLVFYVRYLDRPIRFFGKIGLAILAVAVVITLGLVWAFVGLGIPVVRDHTGWFILALVLYLGGLQSIFVGVLAELLVRLYFEPTRRAPYYVRREALDDAAALQ
ncbi:MAG: glycosyltransferase family 2 protein [Vicinamibacterales bacterium]